MPHQYFHQSLNIATPRTTIISSVNKNIRERKEAKWGKKKIQVGSMVTAKVGDMEEKERIVEVEE